MRSRLTLSRKWHPWMSSYFHLQLALPQLLDTDACNVWYGLAVGKNWGSHSERYYRE